MGRVWRRRWGVEEERGDKVNKVKESYFMSENSQEEVIRAYKKKLLFTSHALNQMNLSDRMILKQEVVETILNGHVIEEYPDDSRGKSYLICSDKPGRNNSCSMRTQK